MILHGDCINKIKELDDISIDAIVTDPPYELGFMGKKWDASGIAYNVELWKECLRVLKPGGHLLAFGGTRTYHRMACAIEDAGFEIRDMLEWIYASGFPKSHNIGKAVDKLQGNERKDYYANIAYPDSDCWGVPNNNKGSKTTFWQKDGDELHKGGKIKRSKGTSEWEGWGTALKPAHEPIVLARKPLQEKTIVENCIKHGTGALDIDGCRIPINAEQETDKRIDGKDSQKGASGNPFDSGNNEGDISTYKPQGRFPANLLVTDDALNDGKISKSTGGSGETSRNWKGEGHTISRKPQATGGFGDSGSKSRYFDIDVWGEKHGLIQNPKASKSERNAGCEGLEEKLSGTNAKGYVGDGIHDLKPRMVMNKNTHPTVKPLHLMSWLVRLVSKKGDTVLDPFMGSGTTGVACKQLDRNFIGIELNEEYIVIAEKRISHQIIQKELFA